MLDGWHISIPNPNQLVMVLIKNDGKHGSWLYFHDKFPSFVKIMGDNCYESDAVPVASGTLESFDVDSLQSMYHIPDGQRYGVYAAHETMIENIPPHKWKYIPPVDYKGTMPFMLPPSKT